MRNSEIGHYIPLIHYLQVNYTPLIYYVIFLEALFQSNFLILLIVHGGDI